MILHRLIVRACTRPGCTPVLSKPFRTKGEDYSLEMGTVVPRPNFFSTGTKRFFPRDRDQNDWTCSCLVFLIDHYGIRLYLVENPSKQEGTSILSWIVFPILVGFLIASLLIWKRKGILSFYKNKQKNKR